MKETRESPITLDDPSLNVYFFTPYSTSGRLGQAYNQYMALVPNDEDWVCFLDRDVLFLTPDYGHQIVEIIARQPEAGLFTCITNRVGCKTQLHQGIISDDPNILNHRRIAEQIRNSHRHEVERISGPVSGFFMLLKKKVWRQTPFDEKRNLLGVDWDFSKRLAAKGFSIYLMRGLYVFHYYRLEGSRADIAHLT